MLDRFALNIGVTTNFLVLLFSDYLKDFVIKGHKEIKQQQVFADVFFYNKKKRCEASVLFIKAIHEISLHTIQY
jgi:hypothetical protein